MPVKCEACLKVLGDDRITRDGSVPEGSVVGDNLYEQIDTVLGRVHTDLEFRDRVGLAHHLHMIRTWFRFHGPWLPSIPTTLRRDEAPVATKDCYSYTADLCEYLSQKSWADEIHIAACASHRELLREMVRQGHR
jgi:hypothetical protein